MKGLKSCLIFVTGAAVGAGSVWFVMNKKVKELEKDMSDKIHQGIELYKEAKEKADKNAETKGSVENLYSQEEDEEVVSESIWDKMGETMTYEDPVHQITLEEYDANEEDAHVSLTYFAQDDMLAASDTLIPVPDDMIGKDIKDILDEADGGEAIYISNDEEETVYEIMIDKYDSLSDLIEKQVDEDVEAYAAEG